MSVSVKPPKPILARPERPAKPVLAKPERPIRPRAPLEAFEAAPDPIDESAFPGDPEGDAAAELGQVETGFRARAKAEAERFAGATDGSYYCVIACESGEQLSALLSGIGVKDPSELFIDGRALADRLGIKLPEARVRYNTSAKVDPRLAKLVRVR